MKKQFISATKEHSTAEKYIPASYLRRCFELSFVPTCAELSISGLGHYLLFINGKQITKGKLAPYVSNPDDTCYFDTYEVSKYLKVGKNAVGVILGNGIINAFGGEIWDFDKAPWRSAPKLALQFCASDGEKSVTFHADGQWRTHPSPILMDEVRFGEIYDARCEIADWASPDFDDGAWDGALDAEAPKGEMRSCDVEPILSYRTVKPVKITRSKDGYVYDFGINSAGLCTLKLTGATPGQKIELRYAEEVRDGELFLDTVSFPDRFPHYNQNVQKDTYIASGAPRECWEPHFTYHGFRYVEVRGITEKQATEELLAFRLYSSALRQIGEFSSSDEVLNTLFDMVKNSDRSNFYYFPTDCPHREKNGWTGDVVCSAEQMALLFDVTESLDEWLYNVCKAQDALGRLPGIVPTAGWGYEKLNGPAWDAVIFHVPYVLYRYRGDTRGIHICREAMLRYLSYIETRFSEDGTVAIGLGDWVQVNRVIQGDYDTPLAVTDSIMVMDMAKKASELLAVIGDDGGAAYAEGVYQKMRHTIRSVLLDQSTATLRGRTQTGQAMGLYYGVFEDGEREMAYRVLREVIDEAGGSVDCGCLGLKAIFRVLSQFGDSELAYHMITKSEFPSYRFFIDRGETAIPEQFREDPDAAISHNHHFLGDIAAWFIERVAGLSVIDASHVRIAPENISAITHAEASHVLPGGRVTVRWERVGECRVVRYTCPDEVACELSNAPNIKYIREK